jgi:hypothetical protein
VVLDQYGAPVQGAVVNATYNRTSLPGGINDLINFYGMSPTAAAEVMNTQLISQAVTDSNGAAIFTQAAGVDYNLLITSGNNTYYYNVMPSSTNYYFELRFPQVTSDSIYNDLYANGNTWTGAIQPNASFITLEWSYQDLTSYTTNVSFVLQDLDNRTLIYNTYQQNPLAGGIYTLNYTIPNIRGQHYQWYENFTRSI